MQRNIKYPLVSVCIPTYNGELFIREALTSVESQKYPNLEIIISDDASCDGTLDVINDFRLETTIPIFIFHHRPNGISSNWNYCMEKANGIYIKFLFQDDLLHPSCISRMVEIMESNSSIELVTCKRELLTNENNRFTQGFKSNFEDLQVNLNLTKSLHVIKGTDILKAPYFKLKPINIIGEPTCYLFKKSIIKHIGDYHNELFQLVDFEFCLRIFKKHQVAFIKDKLVSFRLHSNQASFVNHQVDSNDKDLYYKLLYTDYFWSLHRNFKWLLLKRFHWSFKVYRFFKSIFKKIE